MKNLKNEMKNWENERVDWSYYDRFEGILNEYLPRTGEGETMATQTITAVAKLVYKWYNDGDVYDNTHALQGWGNDLSSYANWLVKYIDRAEMLKDIDTICTEGQYEQIIKALADATQQEAYLKRLNKKAAVGSIYKCDGPFKVEYYDEDEYED